jgi:hypothetical protein
MERAVKKMVESDGGDYETFVVGLCVARGSKNVWRFLAENQNSQSVALALMT